MIPHHEKINRLAYKNILSSILGNFCTKVRFRIDAVNFYEMTLCFFMCSQFNNKTDCIKIMTKKADEMPWHAFDRPFEEFCIILTLLAD